MDFYDVIERVLEFLQRYQRVTYRALQRQFNFDEAYLEDVKAEIIEARQLAVDEGGRVLVWTGPVGATAASTVPEPPATFLPATWDDSPTGIVSCRMLVYQRMTSAIGNITQFFAGSHYLLPRTSTAWYGDRPSNSR
jgi:hypothetical protein